MTATITPIRPMAPPPTITELVDAIRTTNEAVHLAAIDLELRGEAMPLCLALAAERNERLLARMIVR